MPNQKGSIKDRLKARFRFLQYKKLSKKKEKELLKRKKTLEKERIRAEQIRLYGKSYNKVQVFGFTVLGLLIEIFTPKSSKGKVETKLEVVEKDINQIVLKLENDKDLDHIADNIDNTYQKLEDLKKEHRNKLIINSFISNKTGTLLENIDKKQKELHVLNDICKSRTQQKVSASFVNEKLINNKEDKGYKQEHVSSKKNIGIGTQITYNATSKVQEFNEVENEFEPLVQVKKINEELKEYDKEIFKLKEKIDKEKAYTALYDYEFKLKQLKIRINKLLEQYEFLEEKYKYELEKLEEIIDIEVLDEYELRKDNKGILAKFNECQQLLTVIEEKKVILSEKKRVVSNNYIDSLKKEEEIENIQDLKEEKEKKRQKEKKKIQQEFNDIYLANKMIMDNVIREKKMVERLRRQIYVQTPVLRKRSVFVYAKRFTTSILHFGLSLLPIKYFKNRFIGTFVTGVMINNSLRSVRRVLNQDVNYLFYQDLLKEINNNQDYIDRTYDICIDSLGQIKSIRNYLDIHYAMLTDYNIELVEFYNELDGIQSQLIRQVKDLESIDLDYKNIKKKLKKINLNL